MPAKTDMLTIADIMHRDGKRFLRPEYGRLDGRWPVIAFHTHSVMKDLANTYDRGRDIVINTGTQDPKLTREPAYRGRIIAAAIIEPKQDISTEDIVPASSWEDDCRRWGEARWTHCLPALCLYHIVASEVYSDAKALSPHAYSELDYRSGRLRGSAILVRGKERFRLMKLAVTRVKMTLSQAVANFQTILRQAGLETYAATT